MRHQLAPLLFSSLSGALHRLAEALSEISIAYHHSPIVRDQRSKKGALQAGDRAPDGTVLTHASSVPLHLFEKYNSPQSLLLVFAGRQETTAIEHQWHEIKMLLDEGYSQMIEAYLVPLKG